MKQNGHPSGSKRALAVLCQFPFNRGTEWPARAAGADASLGTAVHRANELYVMGDATPLATAIKENPGVSEAALANLHDQSVQWIQRTSWPGTLTAEVSYGCNPRTLECCEIGVGLGRDYSGHEEEDTATVDLVYRAVGYSAVYDWKTGRQRHRKPAFETEQIRFSAFVEAQVSGVDRVFGHLLYVTEDGVWDDSCEFDGPELALIGEEIQALSLKCAVGGPPEPGFHCVDLYCPMLTACPAHQRALATFDAPAPVFSKESIADAAHAARLLPMVKTAEALVAQAKEAVYAWVMEHGNITLDDGSVFGPVEQERKSIVCSQQAVDILKARLGEHAQTALEVSSSLTAITAATKMLGSGRQRTELERGILAELEAVGAIKHSTFRKPDFIKRSKAGK